MHRHLFHLEKAYTDSSNVYLGNLVVNAKHVTSERETTRHKGEHTQLIKPCFAEGVRFDDIVGVIDYLHHYGAKLLPDAINQDRTKPYNYNRFEKYEMGLGGDQNLEINRKGEIIDTEAYEAGKKARQENVTSAIEHINATLAEALTNPDAPENVLSNQTKTNQFLFVKRLFSAVCAVCEEHGDYETIDRSIRQIISQFKQRLGHQFANEALDLIGITYTAMHNIYTAKIDELCEREKSSAVTAEDFLPVLDEKNLKANLVIAIDNQIKMNQLPTPLEMQIRAMRLAMRYFETVSFDEFFIAQQKTTIVDNAVEARVGHVVFAGKGQGIGFSNMTKLVSLLGYCRQDVTDAVGNITVPKGKMFGIILPPKASREYIENLIDCFIAKNPGLEANNIAFSIATGRDCTLKTVSSEVREKPDAFSSKDKVNEHLGYEAWTLQCLLEAINHKGGVISYTQIYDANLPLAYVAMPSDNGISIVPGMAKIRHPDPCMVDVIGYHGYNTLTENGIAVADIIYDADGDKFTKPCFVAPDKRHSAIILHQDQLAGVLIDVNDRSLISREVPIAMHYNRRSGEMLTNAVNGIIGGFYNVADKFVNKYRNAKPPQYKGDEFVIHLLNKVQMQSIFPLWSGPGAAQANDALRKLICNETKVGIITVRPRVPTEENPQRGLECVIATEAIAEISNAMVRKALGGSTSKYSEVLSAVVTGELTGRAVAA